MAWFWNAARKLVEAEKRFEDGVLWGTLFDVKFFSHRYQRRRLREAAQYSSGTLVDIGCAKRPYENIFRPYISHYFGGDYPPGAEERRVSTEKVDVWLDGHQLPFASGCVDTVVNLNVLEHVTSPWKVMSEIGRVLRPGGIAIVNLPFLYPIHGSTDYFRFTCHGLLLMLKENGLTAVLDVADYGAFWAFFAQSLNHYIQYGLFRSNLILYRVSVLLRPFLWLLAAAINLAGLSLDRLNRDERFSLGYVVVARKGG